MAANSFALNYNKTNFINFSLLAAHHPVHPQIVLHKLVNYDTCRTLECDCPKVTRVNDTRYLGVIIDSNLKFKKHVAHIIQKVRFGLYALSRLRYQMDSRILKMVYYAFVQSHLPYCICAWGSANDSTLKPLMMIQKRIIRLVSKVGYMEHTDELFRNNNILPLKNLYAFNVVFYAVKNNIIQSLPRMHGERRGIRYTYTYTPRSTRMQASYQIHLVKILNKLDNNLLTPNRKDALKKAMFDLNFNQVISGIHGV
jgi:hypothetical protein